MKKIFTVLDTRPQFIKSALGKSGQLVQPYGDGESAGKIVARLVADLTA